MKPLHNAKTGKPGKTGLYSITGLLVTLGIVYGDIGTSPLYVMKAITGASGGQINGDFILGALSCIIWTLTLQTTIKYVLIALRADNKGEGGILALYSLVRQKKRKWLYIVALLGAATLVSDGIITPPMTVISAIEGLKVYNSGIDVVQITIFIIIVLFVVQQFGTRAIGKFFGPVMFFWFLMLAVLGAVQIVPNPGVFAAVNPYYAINFLINEPNTLLIMGAVFLCTTGAEALYSDLGHCGIRNIRTTWVYVKVCLILNYLGQGAWVLSNPEAALAKGANPFFLMMPSFFLVPGIIMATLAAIIASQALITGAYTIFSEAMSLNFWPRQKIDYPELSKGQMYISTINWGMLVCCILVVLHFQSSSNMEAAYGLAITITMLMTTVLLVYYLISQNVKTYLIWLFGTVYCIVELGFFYTNMLKFAEGGWIAIMLATAIALSMYSWFNGQNLKRKYIKYVKINQYLPVIEDLINDETIPKYGANLAYVSSAKREDEIDLKVMYSIINKHPKRADCYWFLILQYDNNPYTFDYEVFELLEGRAYKVKFRLGYKIEPMVSVYFNQVLEDMEKEGRFDPISKYPSMRKHDVLADFEYIVIDRVFTHEFLLSPKERFVLQLFNWVQKIGISDQSAWGLESHNVITEKVPIQTEISYDENRIKRRE